MSIENEPSHLALQQLAYRGAHKRGGLDREHAEHLAIWRDGHARGVADERARQASLPTGEPSDEELGRIERLAWEASTLAAARRAIFTAGREFERARREVERGARPSDAELIELSRKATPPGHILTEVGLRQAMFNAGAAWAESGKAEQPPRGPRPEQPYVRGVSRSQSDRYLGWSRCSKAYEAWLSTGRLSREGFDEAITNQFEILNSNVCALIELLTYDGAKTRAEETVLAGETASEYQDRTSKPKS